MGKIFEDARLKLAQSTRHVDNLHDDLCKFFAEPRTHIELIRVPETEDWPASSVMQVTVDPIPKQISLLLGDAVGNLRSSLDLMACEMVEKRGREPSRNLYFPIAETADKLMSKLASEEIASFGEAVCNLIAHEIKPYKGGHPYVWALSQADNLAKHRKLLPKTGASQITVSMVDHVAKAVIEGMTLRIEAGKVETSIQLGPDVRITKMSQVKYTVIFTPDSGFGAVEIISTLRKSIASIANMVDRIESAYLNG
jgi:hypothetical protein